MAERRYDLAVIGGGTGGYVAAIRAAQLGLKTVIIERGEVGGTCLHRGCIPSKALLRTAELLATFRRGREFGIEAGEPRLDYPAVLRRKGSIVGQLHQGVEHLLKKNGVDVIRGAGRLQGPSIFSPGLAVAVDGEGGTTQVIARDFIIATGSRPRALPGLPFDGRRVISSDHALELPELPRRAIIVGGGYIGVEWASLWHDFGVEVTVVEVLPSLLPLQDPDLGAELARSFSRRGIRLRLGSKVLPETVRASGDEIQVDVELPAAAEGGGPGRETLSADVVLVAIGREPVIDGLALDVVPGVRVERGAIQVDARQRTGEPHVYAIGDVVGGVQLAHVAAHQGIIAAEAIAGMDPHPLETHLVARCVYCRPEVASVGLTEAEATAAGRPVRVGRFPFRANGRALIGGEHDGFAKVVIDERTDDVLGVHLIGPHATELIMEPALGRFLNASGWELATAVRPHPTLAEAVGEAALHALGRGIHI